MRKYLSKFLNGKNSLSAASLILIITLFLSNILGLIRDHFLTQKIPTDVLSVYYAAFRIPDLIFNVLILGAISAAFIPVFSSLISQKKSKEAWEVANSVINIAIVGLIFSCIILALIMPAIVGYFVPGFDQEKQNLTIKLARVMLASPVFFGLSYIFGAILNSFKRFAVYSLAPLIYNVSIIAGTLLFADKYSVTGVALAVVAGAFLHMAIQIPVSIKMGFRWQVLLDYKNTFVRKIGILMVPRAIGLGANQILLIIFTSIASALGGSAVAIYNLADNIQTMPMVVFGTSFAMAIFPTLSEQVSQRNFEQFGYYFNKSLRSILFFMLPIVFGIYLLKMQVVRLILGSGHFGWSQTNDTARTLGFFAIALVFTSIIPLLARCFYALHNTKIPMYVTIVTVAISAVIAYILAPKQGVSGLAIAYSIGSFFNALILYLILRKKVIFDEISLVWYTLKVLVASLIMAIALQETIFLTELFVDKTHVVGVLMQTAMAIAVGILIYLLLAWIFNFEEMASIKIILNRLTGRSIVDNSQEPGK